MGISIGNNNKISKSVIGEGNKVAPAQNGGIAREVIVGIVVTIVGGILLTITLTILGLSSQ